MATIKGKDSMRPVLLAAILIGLAACGESPTGIESPMGPESPTGLPAYSQHDLENQRNCYVVNGQVYCTDTDGEDRADSTAHP